MLLAALLLLGARPASAHQDDSVSSLPTDMPVPDVAVKGLDGKTIALPDQQPTLVVFWSVFNTDPLPAMVQAVRAEQARFPRLRVIGVNLDSRALVSNLPQKVRTQAQKLKMTFPQAMDPLRYSRDSYGLRKTPGLILTSQGRIVGVLSFTHGPDAPLLDALVRKSFENQGKR